MGVSTAKEPGWIAVVGDRIPGSDPQAAIEPALQHAADRASAPAPAVRWVPTDAVARDGVALLDGAAGVWCAPGSPYRSLDGALLAIRHAREVGLPFLGTCAGFQHGVIEFARNVLGRGDATHAEYGEEGELFIDELLCSLVGQTMDVSIVNDRVAAMYGSDRTTERYYCRFGLDRRHQGALVEAGLRIAGVDERDEDVRIMRLADHPFFLLTLFVPQTASTPDRPHPLVLAFLDAVRQRAEPF